MRRLIVSAVAASVLLVVAAPANASDPITWKGTFRGSGAVAEFTTMPSGGPAPNVTYVDTYIGAGRDVTNVDGTRHRDNAVYVDRFSYRFDADGAFVPLDYTFGFAHGSAVTLQTSSTLASASASATVALTRCTIDPDGWGETCAGAGEAPVRVDWTGSGAISRGIFISNYGNAASRYVEHYNGRNRAASATGTLGGESLGTAWWAQLFDAKSMSLSICHGC